jgi:hypothetical protein
MRLFYWVYVNVFWCLRAVHKVFSEDYRKPIEVRDNSWMYVDATFRNGETQDVTEQLRDRVRHDALLTPEFLASVTHLENVESWGYLTKALDYNKIPAEGIVNGL